MKVSLWEQDRLGIQPKRSWSEAVVRYLAETSHKASHGTDKTHLLWLHQFLGDVTLDAINRDFLERIRAAKLAEGVKNSTVNRTLEVIRAVLRKASLEWDWLVKIPSVRMLPEPSRRIRWITQQESVQLLDVLPAHLQAMVRFTLETGLRRSNVTGLLWSQVDLVRKAAWVHADQAKARKAFSVPLSQTAVAVIRDQLGKHPTHVFTYSGKPVHQVNTKAWRSALVRAGISDFRWHDLRHTWASWHVQSGTPLYVLQELGGWESIEMVRKYAHLSTEHLAEHVDRLADWKRGNGLATNQLRAVK